MYTTSVTDSNIGYADGSADNTTVTFRAEIDWAGSVDLVATGTENNVIGYTHRATLFTLEGGTVETHDIAGSLDQQWMIDNGYLFADGITWLKAITQANIGNTVTSIGEKAFNECRSLVSITIPSSVMSIGMAAFYYCNGLETVTIGDHVTSIGDFAFQYCSGLASITIPSSVMSIGIAAFESSGLTSVTIPDSVTSIGMSAFGNCINLRNVTIGSGVTSIEEYAFYCSNNL